jgi:RNA polymerase sigma factor (sigma-70 family)
MHRLRAYDPEMWEMAFQLLWPIAWSVANRRLSAFAPNDIEDVAVIAIEEAAAKVKDGKVGSFGLLKALTAVIADRRARDHVRRMQADRRKADQTVPIEGGAEPVSPAPGPLDRLDAGDLAIILMRILVKLPDRQRQLLEGYYLEGFKQAELAKKLGMPVGTVGVTLSRGLASMLKELQKAPKLMQEIVERMR